MTREGGKPLVREPRRDRVDRRRVRLLRRDRPQLRGPRDPADRVQPARAGAQGADGRRRVHRALELPAAAARLEARARAGGGQQHGVQALRAHAALHAHARAGPRPPAGGGREPARRCGATLGTRSSPTSAWTASRSPARSRPARRSRTAAPTGSRGSTSSLAARTRSSSAPTWPGTWASRARGGAWAAYLNAGQVCTSAERFYVERAVYDDFLAAFVEHAESLIVGDPLDPKTDVGPMASSAQRGKVAAQVDAAVAAGATLVTGAATPAPSGPLLHAGGGHRRAGRDRPAARGDLRAGRADRPGRLLLDEAIALANGTRFGLGANVYTRDLETAVRCMREIKAGTVLDQRPADRQRRRSVRRLQAVGHGARARAGGPRALPGDQARPHRDEDRAEGVVVPLRGIGHRAAGAESEPE